MLGSDSKKRKPTSQAELPTKKTSSTNSTSLITDSNEKENKEIQMVSGEPKVSFKEILSHKDAHSKNHLVVAKTLMALQQSLSTTDEMKKALGVGLVTTLVLITRWAKHLDVQSQACGLLLKITRLIDVEFALHEGIAEVCVRTMEDHCTEVYIQATAPMVLGHICWDSQSQASASHIVEQGILQLLLASFEEHQRNPLVVGPLCFFLYRLALHKEFRQGIVQANGFSILCQALFLYGGGSVPQTEANQLHVDYALSCLSMLCEEKLEEGSTVVGIEPIIVALMQKRKTKAMMIAATAALAGVTRISMHRRADGLGSCCGDHEVLFGIS